MGSMSTASTASTSAPSTGSLIEPDSQHRWRCSACGNLTRFDVVRTRRAAEFWHLDLAGDPHVEDATTIEETIESVRCRWCGRADAIEVVERPDAVTPSDRSAGSARTDRTDRADPGPG
jgi:hypothetical protein